MKKRIGFILLLIVLLILFVPVRIQYKDGGSVEYKAILYQVIDVKKLNESSTTGYEEGIIIKIFGLEVFNNVEYEVVVRVHHIDGVTMKIKDNTLTSTSMVIIIEDLNDEKLVFGEEFYIEKKDNDKWIILDPITDDYGFNEIGYLVGDDNKLEMKQDWSKIYGKLDKGNYRLVKNVYRGNQFLYISVEFSL